MNYQKKCPGVPTMSFEDFDKFHTKQLMDMRYNPPYAAYEYYCESCSAEEQCCENREKNQQALREVLATRPHVLNKKESKELRRNRKKQGN